MSERAVEAEGMAEMVQRVADAIEANIPGKMAWVFSPESIDPNATEKSAAIALFFTKARGGQRS